MNLPLLFARRYLLAKRSTNAIHPIGAAMLEALLSLEDHGTQQAQGCEAADR
ncbi:MAG: hypothetical protein ACK46C_07630 [Flavobacteriales bacterium]